MRKCLLAFGLMALVSGCFTVDLSDTMQLEDRLALRGGPGARQGELVRLVRLEQTHYSGDRISFGLFPGVPSMASDFGGGVAGYVPATVLCLFVGPFVNAFALATPTLCTLFVEPFTATSYDRGLTWDAIAMGFVGTYRWRVLPHDDVDAEESENVLVDGGYCPDLMKIGVSESEDGVKLWHAYPGFRALVRDVERDGEVDVLFPDGDEIRRFSRSDLSPACLAFEDRPIEK